jgi:CBS domain-containing protein
MARGRAPIVGVMHLQEAPRTGRSVGDVMTGDPFAVTGLTSSNEIVRLLTRFKISSVPVIDVDGRPTGIVSESDLLLKGEPGVVAADLMSSPVHTIPAKAGLGEAARLFRAKRVKRLPVVDDDGMLVGMLSHSDMLTAFMRPDTDLVRDVREEVMVRTLWMDPDLVSVTAIDGIVNLQGVVARRSDIPILTRLIHGVDGVVGITSSLTYRFDDTRGMDAPTGGLSGRS